MNYKVALLAFIFLNIFGASAQTEEISSHQINWKGVEKWYADSSSVNVISFDGAQYPTDNRLPYFNKRISCDQAFSYQVEVANEDYTSLSIEESMLVNGTNFISNNLQILTDILTERGANFLDIRILPFINQQGKIVKLQSFNLIIKKLPKPQKAATVTRRTYEASSVLAQGKFVKVKIENSGVYKLTYEDLVSMGISPNNVRVFGYGGALLDQSFTSPKIDDLPELAIYMNKGADGVFNASDYILFYGQGVTKWIYDKPKALFTHAINSYSKYGYYFVTSDAGVGKRITDKTIILPTAATINQVQEFTDYQVHEKELTNLSQSGKEFYGETFNDITSYNLPFSFLNPILTSPVITRLDVAASSSVSTSFSLTLNGAQAKILSVSARYQGDNYTNGIGSSAIFSYSSASDTYNFGISYNKSGAVSTGYLNYLEVNVRRQLKMSGSAMQFQNIDYLGKSAYSKYLLSDANANVQIWDISDQQNISSIPTQMENGKLTFVDSSNNLVSYIAIDPTASSAFPKPEIVGVVPNQNLHSINQADMVILTHPNFLSQSETLAKAHREKDNLTVSVVTTDQVYNEFSSGTPDATAYRWVLKMLYDRALNSGVTADLPKYLLLFGKGSFDNRKILSNSGDNSILTYQTENSLVTTLSYVTDDYFTLLDDNEGANVPAGLMDVGVGRLSVSSAQQATDVVNKITGYMDNKDKGYWKNQLCFLADDGDGSLHSTQTDTVASSVGKKFPVYQLTKIYLDAYKQEITASGESYPLAKSRFQNLIRSGAFMINYTGHGGPNGWTNENILSINDVKSFSNKHLPIWVAPTCDFNIFDGQAFSAGEEVVLNPVGAGIASFSAARPVYASQNFVLNKLFCDNLFRKRNGEHMRVGDVIVYAKNSIGTEINKLSYIYLGDPALRLNYPTKYKVITTKINESETLGSDTLRALSVATIQGAIVDDGGNKIDNFNGTVHVVVYDKVQRITSLNNHNDGTITFSDRPNTLFSGDVAVTGGAFNVLFMIPKDIRYNFGSGRINYYAQDDINDYEAQGYFENFIIGGTNKTALSDTEGPNVELFLNSSNFISGDKVNETPLFISNLSDNNGINTVGSGIGHDLMLTLDKDPLQSYIINDYYQAKTNSYTEGTVNFKLPEMKDGKHTLSFKSWDLLNNSTTNTIDFEVVKGLTPKIFSVSNYPNPVKTTGITNIIVNHDRPETILSTTVEIFDTTGRKIWAFSQKSADNITWNLISNSGQMVKTGIYFYRVNIKTSNSDSYSKTNKMLVVE
ncbi:MAG: type IX secretion system sortase PorU [Paludibacter sp.]|nr:type IX secretion system sortase PorU [Paludibacter sp.]